MDQLFLENEEQDNEDEADINCDDAINDGGSMTQRLRVLERDSHEEDDVTTIALEEPEEPRYPQNIFHALKRLTMN